MKRSIFSLAVLLFAAPTFAARCDTDPVPAATLLVPYFEVDLADAGGRTTLFSVHNAAAAPRLVKVTYWTDWAVRTASFEVYLAGYDIQTFNARDLLLHGRLPATGSAISPAGNISDPNVDFPGCAPGPEPTGAPVYADPAFSGSALAELQALHTGQPSPLSGKCGAYPWGDGIARGYVTIDVVSRCSDLRPPDAGYLTGESPVAGTANVLIGDVFHVNAGQDFAQGEPAVHVEAFPGEFAEGDLTFYGRYVGNTGTDHREPLPTQFAIRYLNGGAFTAGTRVMVWRDTGSPDHEPVECPTSFDGELPDNRPSWSPLFMRSERILFLDEQARAEFGPRDGGTSPGAFVLNFPWATQTAQLVDFPQEIDHLDYPPGRDFGMMYLSMRVGQTLEGTPLQGWVAGILSAEGRYSIGLRAQRLDSGCEPGGLFPVPSIF